MEKKSENTMNEQIDVKSLMRVSKFAQANNKSVAWVYSLVKENQIDMIIIDGYHFIRINEKSKKYLIS